VRKRYPNQSADRWEHAYGMTETYQTLFSDAFLRAVFDKEFQAFRGGAEEKQLLDRLGKWSSKAFQKETTAEGAFAHLFFEETWGYIPSGKNVPGEPYTFYPKYPVAGAGQGGGTGEADAALAIFDHKDIPATPQVVCEFKDVRSNLDAPQKRKGNNRSPVKQCADYLREAVKPLYGNEAVQPTWGIVTDMNEFRLYWRNTMPSQFQRFIIKKATTDEGTSLLEQSDSGSFQRFLFVKLFHRESLLSAGGPSALLRTIRTQGTQQKEIENTFYREYRAYREHLVNLLIDYNPSFPGTKGRLVRLAQKLIDRCIFVMFCEDMGEQLSFPPHALRDYLSDLSKNSTYDPDEQDAWNKLKELFKAMNEGKKFQSRPINRFNGGLFADDHDLHNLQIPNKAFCVKFQAESEADLISHPLTLLYFAGSYNFGTGTKDRAAITLYTLGRIFEQSITELEALEAAADERQSITVISKRKRDGVYYTPEWVVERVVAETVGPRLDEIRSELGWDFDLEGDETEIAKQVARSPSDRSKRFIRHADAVASFRERMDAFTVLDPACGSGAFLIHTLEYLLRERRRTSREFALVTGGKGEELFSFKQDVEVREILARNIFGVDINPASVEIARLALWLHTAKSDQPLSNLDSNVLEGNSLVSSEIFEFKKDLLSATQTKKETINAFDFEKAFSSVFDPARPGGRDSIASLATPHTSSFKTSKRSTPRPRISFVTQPEKAAFRDLPAAKPVALTFSSHSLRGD
jgi:N-6 DNA Methylase